MVTTGGLLAWMCRMKRALALSVVIAVCPLLANCYGAFPLTKVIYRANGNISNGLLRQIVFWVFVIVPVYGVAMFADAVALNLIDFWFGEGSNFSSTTDAQGNTVALQPSRDGREAVLTVSKDGRTLQELRFVRASDTQCDVYDTDGALVGRALRTPSVELRLTDASDQTVALVGASELAQVLAERAALAR